MWVLLNLTNYRVGLWEQGSLSELDTQLQEHPSILPADFNIAESGELELSVQRSIYEPDYQTLPREFDDQRVPVAKLSSSSGEPSSPQVEQLLLSCIFVEFDHL